MEVCLRQASAEDFDFTFHVRQTAFGAAYLVWDEEAELRRHRDRFSRQEFGVIECNGEPVGFVAFAWEPGRLHLFQLHVLPEAQGRGIGWHALGSLTREAEARGVPIELRVQKNNPGALRFYRRYGFVDDGETETHFQLKWTI